MKKLIISMGLILIITILSALSDDIKYCNTLREETLNNLITNTLSEMETPGDIFRFFEAELRLREFCKFENILIPNKWNFTSRLAINNWSTDKHQFGVIALKLEDIGFLLTDYKRVICNRNLEVRNANN